MSSEPRDLRGHVGHQKLREFWQSRSQRGEVVDEPTPVSPPISARARRQKTEKKPRSINRTSEMGRAPKLDDKTVTELYSRYVAGESVKALAASVGVERGTLDRHFRRKGFPRIARIPAPKQRAPKQRAPKLTEEQLREAISANERGISWKQIAIDMRINAKTLRKYIAGIGYKSNGYRRCVPIEKITQAIDMRNKGVAWKDVSASVGYSRRHLQDLIKKYQEAA